MLLEVPESQCQQEAGLLRVPDLSSWPGTWEEGMGGQSFWTSGDPVPLCLSLPGLPSQNTTDSVASQNFIFSLFLEAGSPRSWLGSGEGPPPGMYMAAFLPVLTRQRELPPSVWGFLLEAHHPTIAGPSPHELTEP